MDPLARARIIDWNNQVIKFCSALDRLSIKDNDGNSPDKSFFDLHPPRSQETEALDHQNGHPCPPPGVQEKRINFLRVLPTEIRMHLYQIMFKADKPIRLHVNESGYISKQDDVYLPLQSLRVCKKLHHEASLVVYGVNVFATSTSNLRDLPRLHQPCRFLIEHVELECDLPIESGDRSNIDHVDICTIDQAFPCMQILDIKASESLKVLEVTARMCSNLPLSSLRPWPTLIVEIEIPDEVFSYHSADWIGTETSSAFKGSIQRLGNMCATDRSHLGLGREMPEIGVIRISGQLSERLCRLVENHKCSFGDCRFKKEVVREQTTPDFDPQLDPMFQDLVAASPAGTIEMPAMLTNPGARYRFTWCREGDVAPSHVKTDEDESANLHQWVPRLGPEVYKQILESGVNVYQYDPKEPIRRAASEAGLDGSKPSHVAGSTVD